MNGEVFAQANEIYQEVLPRLFTRKNVVACGLGYKVRGEEQTEELSLIVSVVRKVPVAELAPEDLVPKAVDGLPTDVVETGYIRAQLPTLDPKARHRPAMPGISIGHYRITAGTFGLLVQRDGALFILSNNHVLANSNDARIGDAILQPGPLDGGTQNDRLATLAEFEPLDFGEQPGQCSFAKGIAEVLNALANVTGSSHRLQSVQKTPGENLMDAALGRVEDPALVEAAILGIGLPTGVGEPLLGLPIQKAGRTTGYTQDRVQQVNVTVNVDYQGRVARFTDQIIAGRMSSPGDSGSGILDMNRRGVGLLFAGSEQVTIFTPLQRVLDRFRVTLNV